MIPGSEALVEKLAALGVKDIEEDDTEITGTAKKIFSEISIKYEFETYYVVVTHHYDGEQVYDLCEKDINRVIACLCYCVTMLPWELIDELVRRDLNENRDELF